MDASSSPLELHICLQCVLKDYRATPHTSTEQTPFELIKTAPTPVMFPQLLDIQCKIQESNRNTVPRRNTVQGRKDYNVGDIVCVYDNLSKVNNVGVIKEIKSNNSYLVNIDNVVKHISGDNISIIQKLNNTITNDTNDNNDSETNSDISEQSDIILNEDSEFDFSDTESVMSDLEFPSDSNIIVNNNNFHRRKKYCSELERLNVGFPLPVTKTRSGRL